MFSADVIMLELLSLFSSEPQDSSGTRSELFKPVPVTLIECAECLNEILFLLTQLLYAIFFILNRLPIASCTLYTWCLHTLHVNLALLRAALFALFAKHPKRLDSHPLQGDPQAFQNACSDA